MTPKPSMYRHFVKLINELPAGSLVLPLTAVACYILWCRYRFVRKYNQLFGFKFTFGLIGLLNIILQNGRRCESAVAIHELISSLPIVQRDEENSGICCIFVGPMPIIIITNPESARIVLTHESTQVKGKQYDIIRWGIGDGLITSHGDRWMYHRKLITPAFHFKKLGTLVPIVKDSVETLLSRLESETSSKSDRLIASLLPHISACTLDTLCQSSLGIDSRGQEVSNCPIQASLGRSFDIFTRAVVTPWMWCEPLFKLSKIGREYIHTLSHLRLLSHQVICNRIQLLKQRSLSAKEKGKELFIDTLINEHIKNPEKFTLEDIHAETNVFLIAGHDTTSWSIIYALFLLGHHPEVQQQVHAEIDAYFDENDELTYESIKQFEYTTAVLKESMRIYPPVPVLTRTCQEEIQVDRYLIPKGTSLLVSVYLVHRDPRHWSDPHRFKPERFLGETHHPYSFIPFSAGQRNCLGQRFAMVQATSVIIHILRKYSLESVTQQDEIKAIFAPNFTSRTPIQVKFHRRDTIQTHGANNCS